jgi:uroporphyrinogen-III decarboxylase
MRPDQWNILEAMISGEQRGLQKALIIDSPWIPSFLGISTEDFVLDETLHLESWMKIVQQYPDIIFFPDFWVERGMAAEPSGFGTPVTYYPDHPPTVGHIFEDIEDAEGLKEPDPRKDGLVPIILSQYSRILPKVREAGMDINIVAARGPMTLASHLMGVTNFLLALKSEPEKTHRLLQITTATVKRWIMAQSDVLPACKGYLVLDDIMGFLSEEDYLEFAHPYFSDVFSIPAALKGLHNDTPNPVAFSHIPELGVNLFNFSHELPIPRVRSLVGDGIMLMGNIPPLEVMAQGSEEAVRSAAARCIAENGRHPRFLLSAGGGTSMGTPDSSIRALAEMQAEYR